jgi:cell division protein FtsB
VYLRTVGVAVAVGSKIARSGAGGHSLWGGAGLALALLTASLTVPALVLAASPSAENQVTPLDRLSTTLGDLKSSLAAIRADLEGMRSTATAAAWSPPDALCSSPAEPSAATDLTAGELERLRNERAALKNRVAELEKEVEKARPGEVVAGVVERPSGSPTETAVAAELDPPRGGSVLEAAKRETAPEAVATDAPAGADGAATLQLRAELALAQLKITDLNEELQTTRANKAALKAEVRSLRSLTDAKIKRFMGWQ